MTLAQLPDEGTTVVAPDAAQVDTPGAGGGNGGGRRVDVAAFRLIGMSASRARSATSGRGWWLAVGWITLVVVAAALADLLPLHGYGRVVTDMQPRSGLGLRLDEPFGTDGLNRSMLSRVIYGGRQSLLVGGLSALTSAAAGMVIGVTMGYLRGKVDAVLSLVLDALLAFPALVLLMAIAAVGRRDIPTVVVALSVLGAPIVARLVRAQALALAEREFILAAKAMGATRRRIIFREILPHVFPLVLAVLFLILAVFIVAEGALSFVGLGIPPPAPSWGGMINDGRPFLQTAPHLIFLPALFLVLTVLSFRVLGERLQARLDGGIGARR